LSLTIALLVAAAIALFGGAARASAAPFTPNAPDDHSVLILSSTVNDNGLGGDTGSWEEFQANALGLTPVIASPTDWASMTTANFATYRALILGDPTCQIDPSTMAAAVADGSVWGPAVGGNVVVLGTDPTFHSAVGVSGAQTLIKDGINFAAAKPGQTGMYIALSCYYFDSSANTPVPVLDPFGAFTVQGQDTIDSSCPNTSHIVGSSPALLGLSDADLSNWSCSTHEVFNSFPLTFDVLAVQEDDKTGYVATDGTAGGPYILARGVTVISNIHLTPETATNPTGTSHTVTATVTTNVPSPGTPVAGTTVTFTVVSGPNAGTTGTATTDSSGVATFTYLGSGGVGTDFIQATFVDSNGKTETSNTAQKTWTTPTAPPPSDCSTATPLIGDMSLTRSGVDTNTNGLAEAFKATATASGTLTTLCVYLDSTNTAMGLEAGIYSNSFTNHPGTLLAKGSLSGLPVNGGFNTITVPSVPLAAGTTYWIALLSPAGTTGKLEFRDHCCGYQSTGAQSGPSENSLETNLLDLPATWSTGKVWPLDGHLLTWGGGSTGS
jgi:hypothetical protein